MLPDGWDRTTVGDVCDVLTGGTPNRSVADYWNGDIPWMSSGEINQRVVRSVAEFITPLGMANSNARLLPTGTVMMALNGQGKTRGKVAILEIETTCNQSLAGMVADRKRLLPAYLFYSLDAQYQAIRNITGDDARNGLNLGILRGLSIDLPPLDEQRRIAEVLRSVDEAIKATEAELNGLRNVTNALIEEHCITAASDGISPIGDFATFVGSGVTPKGGKAAYVDQGIAFIRSQNVHFDGLRADGLAFIDTATDAKMARTRVHPDDVLLNITGASIGRCTIVPKGFGPANVNQHVCIIRPNPAVVLPSYLSLFLSSHDGQRQIDQLQGGLSREGLNFQQVRAINVPTPPLDVQAELAETIGATRSMMQVLERDLAGKKDMRSGISADLLSGRARVPA